MPSRVLCKDSANESSDCGPCRLWIQPPHLRTLPWVSVIASVKWASCGGTIVLKSDLKANGMRFTNELIWNVDSQALSQTHWSRIFRAGDWSSLLNVTALSSLRTIVLGELQHPQCSCPVYHWYTPFTPSFLLPSFFPFFPLLPFPPSPLGSLSQATKPICFCKRRLWLPEQAPSFKKSISGLTQNQCVQSPCI